MKEGNIMTERKYKFETLQVRAGQESPDSATGARAVPVYSTTAYVFENTEQAEKRFGLSEGGNIYSRLTNPTTEVFEKRIAALEGGIGAVATSSGAAAVAYAVQNIVRCGEHIVSAKSVYGGTYNLFAHTLTDAGIETTFVKGNNPKDYEKAIKENTRLIYAETLDNPNCSIADIDALAEIAHRHNIPLVVDNTFATPYLFRPIEHGADIVVHSASKFIGGHGAAIGGVIVDSGKFDWAKDDKFPGLSKPNPSYHGIVFTDAAGDAAYITKIRTTLLRDTGSTLSPFNSFLFIQGLETLSLRLERHVENTLAVVKYLLGSEYVEKVNYPSLESHPDHELYKKYYPKGAGSVFTFEIKGTEKDAKAFIDRLELFSQLANVADVKSLVIHPASTTHSQMTEEELADSGIKPNTIRLSIGTEHIDDIIYDIDKAFKGERI